MPFPSTPTYIPHPKDSRPRRKRSMSAPDVHKAALILARSPIPYTATSPRHIHLKLKLPTQSQQLQNTLAAASVMIMKSRAEMGQRRQISQPTYRYFAL